VATRQSVHVDGPRRGARGSGAGAGEAGALAPLFEGRTKRNEIVHVEGVPGRGLTGELVEVDVRRANKHSLFGVATDAAIAALPAAARTAPARRKRALPLAP
jgi:tRNA-2-methylthio-N6-dimethylallyladenosine synthase